MASSLTAVLMAAATLLLLSPPSTTATPMPSVTGLDPLLSTQYRHDPHATNDTHPLLPPRLRSSLPSLLLTPPSLTLPISLHIHLVGPTFSPSSSSLLSSFLSSSLSSSPFHLLSSPNNHSLSLSHSLHVTTSLSPPSLSSSLSSALSSSLSSSPSSLRSSLSSVPFSSIDSIIQNHHHHSTGIHIYLINLGPQSKPYAYSYSSSNSEPSPAFTKCLGSIWAGKARYIWIDLAAGPLDYGPALSGDGLSSLPKSSSSSSLISDLASLVHSAYNVLIVPPLQIPVQFETSLLVQFIHIRGTDTNNMFGLDWKEIEKEFTDGLLVGDQALSFRKYEIGFKDCALCSFAVSKAVSSYTSRFLFDNYTLIVSEYLDSKKLHQVLSDSGEEFRRLAGIREEDDNFGRVLPVYVFDLDYSHLLLLDRYHQSVSFKDMVVAVRTRNTQTVSEYSCNGRHVFIQTRELQRPLVGSILQSMWGVSPTHMVWSPTHNGTLIDYTWSVGQTPFGPFSEVSSLSFVQKDAARRNVLLTSLNYTVTSAVDVIESVKAHGGYQKLLRGKQQTEFSQRWFLFNYKLDKMVSALSHWDFELASYYLKSSDHDLYAMHSIVYHTSQELEASLACFKDPPVPWASVSMSAGTFVLLCFVYAKRDKFFQNKRKQF